MYASPNHPLNGPSARTVKSMIQSRGPNLASYLGVPVSLNSTLDMGVPAKPTALNPPPGVPSRDEDVAWYQAIQARFESLCADKRTVLFGTNIGDQLFLAYLDALPAQDRQYHNCRTCQRFFDNYGGLVLIRADGSTESAMWSAEDAPEYYKPAVKALIKAVKQARVNRVFYTGEAQWGTLETGEWCHYALTLPRALSHLVCNERIYTAFQQSAEKSEDFKNVIRALEEYNENTLSNALVLLRADDLYRAEKVLGPVEWLYNLNREREANLNAVARNNLVWRAIATAPKGYAHPRSSMAGTLLDDLAAGMDRETVKARFASKMHPLQYQRPTAAPTEGNIKRGEELVAKLGIAESLQRRYARPEDVTELLWQPTPVETETKPPGGVFGHLNKKSRAGTQTVIPEATMTWAKFMRTVVPEALEIDIRCPSRGSYVPLTTAVNPSAPPILQWDREGQRNPVSWYCWHGGSPAAQFGLQGNAWAPLWGITKKPCHWNGNSLSNFGPGAMFLVQGAKESRFNGGLALFPETLRSELHEVRSTIEAHSRSGVLGNTEGPHAVAVCMEASAGITVDLRVKTAIGTTVYKIDRWD